MIGDGFTDYEVFAHGRADHFIFFTENIIREKVAKLSKNHAKSFDEALEIINKL